MKDTVKNLKLMSLLYDFIPIVKWLPEYPIKKNLIGDFLSGFTIAVMHIPQGKLLLYNQGKALNEPSFIIL